MEEFQVGDHVYEIFDPSKNGLVSSISPNSIIVDIGGKLVTYEKQFITKNYHTIINNLIVRVGEWKELWFEKKNNYNSLLSQYKKLKN